MVGRSAGELYPDRGTATTTVAMARDATSTVAG